MCLCVVCALICEHINLCVVAYCSLTNNVLIWAEGTYVATCHEGY